MVKKLIKTPKIVQSLLSNKYVLYFVLVVSIVHVVGYIQMNNWDALALFMAGIVIGSYFTKNMILILFGAMLLGNCKICADQISSWREGFQEGAGTKMSSKVRSSKKSLYLVNEKTKCQEATNRKRECKGGTGCKGCKGKKACFGCDDWGTKCGKQKKPKGCKKKSGFTQRSEPMKLDSNNEETDVDINYGAAIETAFGALDKMIGKNSLNNLSNMGNTTSDLVDTQKKLMDSITDMGPLITSAKETLDNMDLPDVTKMNQMLSKINSGSNSGLMAK